MVASNPVRAAFVVSAFLGLLIWGRSGFSQCVFSRGDTNDSGVIDLNDAVDILSFIYIGNTVPPCYDAADANDNGLVELSDYIYMAKWFFNGGPEPPPPFNSPGPDPTPGITIQETRDPRFSFKIGEAIGFASNTGLEIPLYVTNQVAINGFQMVFQYDGSLLRIDEMLPGETALEEASAEYIIHQAFNGPGITHAGYSTLIDFATPIQYRVLPPGTDQLVGKLKVSVSLIADPGETELRFVDGVKFPDDDPPETLAPVHNLVVLDVGAVRPLLTSGKVIVRKAFIRGDSNQDKRVDISDGIFTLGYVFRGEAPPPCFDAADSNNDSRIDISDPIWLFSYLFSGGPQPSSPFPLPGVDPDHDRIDCAEGL